MIPTQSPFRPLSVIVPAAASATAGVAKSVVAQTSGFIVQQLTLGGTNPNTFYVGANKQPPSLWVVRDAFIAATIKLATLEFWNYSTTTALQVTGVLFDGIYTPSANAISTISGIGNGLFSPLVTSPATLAALTTIGLTPSSIIEYVDSTTLALVSWQLTFNASSPVTGVGITVPNDYNAVSNPYVWIQV